MSRTPTMSGGSEMMRRSPSTTEVNLRKACIESFVCALATLLRARFSSLASWPCWANAAAMVSTSILLYQISRFVMPAKLAIEVRYCRVAASRIDRRVASSNSLDRPATSSDVTSRFRSHSHGPGLVSSKSLMSKIRLRSGDANPPKLARWASPQACTTRPESGVFDRSEAMISAAPR